MINKFRAARKGFAEARGSDVRGGYYAYESRSGAYTKAERPVMRSPMIKR